MPGVRVLQSLRRQRQRYIDANPIDVTINRVERLQDPTTGGRTAVSSTVGPFRCRIAQMRVDVSVAGQNTETVGQYLYANRYALICPHTVDLRAGGQVRDNIDLPGYGAFYIREINRETMESGTYGFVAHLELRG